MFKQRNTVAAKDKLLRFFRFCAVGGSGVLVDMFALHVLSGRSGPGGIIFPAKLCAAGLAMVNNFAWNELWTFRGLTERLRALDRLKRFAKFSLICSGGILISASILVLLVQNWG